MKKQFLFLFFVFNVTQGTTFQILCKDGTQVPYQVSEIHKITQPIKNFLEDNIPLNNVSSDLALKIEDNIQKFLVNQKQENEIFEIVLKTVNSYVRSCPNLRIDHRQIARQITNEIISVFKFANSRSPFVVEFF